LPFLHLAHSRNESFPLLEVWDDGIRPLVVWINFKVVSSQNDETYAKTGVSDCKLQASGLRTRRRERLSGNFNLDSGTLAFSVRGATSQESARNEFVDPLFIALECASVCGRMDRRMGFIVLLPISGSLEGAIGQTGNADQINS
jgi:hypothetical protein